MTRHLIRQGLTRDEMAAGFAWDIPDQFNMADACCDSWAATEPDRCAVTHLSEDGSELDLGYGALKDASDAAASAMSDLGLAKGDRVAILLPQCPETLIAHFAAWKIGAITLPLFTLFGPDALRFRLADSGAALIITNPDNEQKIREIRDDLPVGPSVWITGPGGAFEAACRPRGAVPPRAATSADDPATLIYTSGTTGPPKGALHAHRFLLGHLPSVELHHPGIGSDGDVGWTPADWAWIGGLMDLAMPCLYYGVPLISCRFPRFEAGAAYALMRDHGVTRAFIPPTALRLMRQVPPPKDLALRSVGTGGESLGADLLDWGRDTLGAPINEFYGQTECNLVLTSAHGLMEVRAGSMGKPVPGHEVAVIGADGDPLPDGEVGEIAVKHPDPVMFLGYWNQPDKTRAKFTSDWMRTGDLGRRDGDGYFWYVSRDDDVITSAGYRIGPTEIEACLASHPDVVMAAAVGVPDPVRTEIVKAFVVLRTGTALGDIHDALVERVRTRVSPHVAPREIEAVAALPMTATGKIMRRELRERG